MTRKKLLDDLKAFTIEVTKDILLPCAPTEKNPNPEPRAASVYLMRLPDSSVWQQKAPYILHQLVMGSDFQEEGKHPSSVAVMRTVVVVYGKDEQDGSLALLDLMERMRYKLERQIVIGEQFVLDMESKVDQVFYPDNTAPYYIGEMSTTWKIPAIQREVRAVCL